MRFVGLLPSRDAGGQDARRKFVDCLAKFRLDRVVDSANGLLLAAEPGLARVASADGRVLLGAAYDQGGRAARADELAGLDADQLLSRYWGPCLAIAPCPGPAGATFARFNVARDPSGGLECYLAATPSGIYVTSDLALALRAGLATPMIDWGFLAHDLVYRRARGVRTCLSGVDELAPGQAATIGVGAIEIRLFWDPWRVRDPSLDRCSLARAAHVVRSRIDLCGKAMSTGLVRPVLELSGGLDSSIVAAALADHPGLSAVHCVSPGPEGDERRYAQAVAGAFAVPLEEHVLRIGRFDPGRVADPNLPRPGRPGVLGPAHRIVQAHCRARKADAIFTGVGGDSVFCSLSTPAPVADRFWRSGPGIGFLRSLGDLSVRHNTSIWTVAAMTGRSIRRRFDPTRGASLHFLTPEAIPDRQDLHPWLAAAPPGALLGHSLHVEAIAFILGYMAGQARMTSIPTLAPLLARPVLEACLDLPAWRWIEGGRDRSVARMAYRGRLPDLVINRRSKGAVDHYVTGLFLSNRRAVRELLLDGLLVQAGILDRSALEAELSGTESRIDHAQRVLELADAEAWARGWSNLAGSRRTAGDGPP